MFWSQKITKNHLDTTENTSSENHNYQIGNMGENKKKSLWKRHPFSGISPKCVWTPLKETGCHIFKMTIFSNFFDDFMRHIIG